MNRTTAAIVLLIGMLVPGTAAAIPCNGTACHTVTLDLDRCLVRNSANVATRVVLYFNPFAQVNGEVQRQYPFVSPGQAQSLSYQGHCPTTNQVTSYDAFLLTTPSPENQAALRAFLGGGPSASCTGTACASIRLQASENCIWAINRNARPIIMRVTLADRTVDVSLDGADARKVGTGIVNSSNFGDQRVDPQCAQAHQTEKFIENMKSQGNTVPDDPELDRILDRCWHEEKAAAASPVPTPTNKIGVQTMANDSIVPYPVYWGKILTPSGCISDLKDIRAYSANYQ